MTSPSTQLRPQSDAGHGMYALIRDLYPICRSITGDGLRATLQRVAAEIPITIHEVPSGTQVFDWTVPKEWNIHDAFIKNSKGERVVDFACSNLHVVNYSVPVRGKVSREELLRHIHTLPEHPDWIPYRTSYYNENWGFCVTERQRQQLTEPEYEVCIDSTLENGSLSYGEACLPGAGDETVVLTCHCCHPSLGNDNLSGIALAVWLTRFLASEQRRYSYRVLFIPGTIGSITWLAKNEALVPQIRHGLVLACVGDAGAITYKRSRAGSAVIDRAVEHVLRQKGEKYRVVDFSPYGYDERQFNSPGFQLPVGRFSRTPHGEYPEYHTSADNLELVRPEALQDSYETCLAILRVLEQDRVYRNLQPKCEPQLGKRGLYRAMGGYSNARDLEMAMLWVLNYSDGSQSLLQIAERANMRFESIADAAGMLLENSLLQALDVRTKT